MLLAIDTASQFASLALYDADAVWAEQTWQSTNNHTAELTPTVERMLAIRRLAPRDLSGVVVSLGPGSFSGLRVGVSFAKGFAFAADIPLIGVPTLDVLAYAQTGHHLPIWALIRAGRGRVCAGFYPTNGVKPSVENYLLTTLEQLPLGDVGSILVAGEIDQAERENLQHQWGAQVIISTPAPALRRAGYLAELGWQRLQRGEVDDLSTLSPIYLQRPTIQTKL
jgi:tRNA threonylcarbamoyladenosine biosynthesis protein TsaB